MKQLMEKFQSAFDLVVYDTSHLFGLTDASFLTAEVDEVLMVVAASKTNRTAMQRVLNKLTTLPVQHTSLVVNYLKEQGNSTGTYISYPQGGQNRRERQASV
jgi:Mrp family chromosome partitioning ATPase